MCCWDVSEAGYEVEADRVVVETDCTVDWVTKVSCVHEAR